MFQALELAIQLATDLGDALPTLRRHSKDLAGHAERAATSIALNLSEGNGRQGRDRLHFFRIARGSANELHTALRLAFALRHLPANPALLHTSNRVCAILCRLAR